MAWTLTVRRGPKVARSTHPDLDAALAALEAAVAGAPRRSATEVLGRGYGPERQVSLRGELRGPRRRHGGLDVQGDGSLVPWTGRFARRPVVVEPGEQALHALARTLGD